MFSIYKDNIYTLKHLKFIDMANDTEVLVV